MQRKDATSLRSRQLFGVLDVGSTKVCCIIAEPVAAPPGSLRAIGFGLTRSRGIKADVVVDLDEAEDAVRTAVAMAERGAGTRLDRVYAGVACGRLRSHVFTGRVDLQRGIVEDRDIEALHRGARGFAERDGRTLVHLNRLDYLLDLQPGIRDPRGLVARQLAAELHAVTADDAPLRNLLLLLDKCDLGVEGLVPTGLASAIAATSPDERRLGVTCLDIGGGTTTIAMFHGGHFMQTDAVPVGGKHVTFDIARELITPLAEAERIKTLYGTLTVAASDGHERIAYPGADDTEHETTKARLSGLVRHRYKALLGLARAGIERSAAAAVAGDHVVITGGASQMLGLDDFAANVLGRPVRIARAPNLAGLPDAAASPSLSAAVGLIASAASTEHRLDLGPAAPALGGSYLCRVERWLRESF